MSSMVASNLIFLSELPKYKEGDKVRFLGCVNSYDVQKGILALFHDYPLLQPRTFVQVDVSHVLETVSNEELQVGAWLNVVGYLTNVKDVQNTDRGSQAKGFDVGVQAILLWSAEGVRLDEYERALEMRRESLTPHLNLSSG